MTELAERKTAEIRTVSTVDELEAMIIQMPPAECPLTHTFTPGLYLRQIFIPAGTILTSMIHNTEHPFMVIMGEIDVISQFETQKYIGPFMGVTQPGTKRALYAHTDTIWITVHANPDNLTDPDAIVEDITEPLDNPLIEKDDPRVNMWRKTKSPSAFHIGETLTQEKISCQ